MDEEIRAAALAVLARGGGEIGTTALAKAVLVEMEEDQDRDAIDSVCKALYRWKEDGGPAAQSKTQRTKWGKPLLVWASGASVSRGKVSTAQGVAEGSELLAVLERIAAALERAYPPPAAPAAPVVEPVVEPAAGEAEPSLIERRVARIEELEARLGQVDPKSKIRMLLHREQCALRAWVGIAQSESPHPEDLAAFETAIDSAEEELAVAYAGEVIAKLKAKRAATYADLV